MKVAESHINSLRWRRYSRKAYAVFRSLNREVSIGVLGVAMLASCAFVGHPAPEQQLQKGDLLFCVEQADGGGLGQAIASVTQGVEALNITHVAIFVGSRSDEGAACLEPQVLEAVPDGGVHLLSIHEFLKQSDVDNPSSPSFLVARLRDTTGVASSVVRAFEYLGRPYDFLYQPSDSAIYCSELVQFSYRRPDGTPMFPTIGMTFRDSTGQIAEYWQQLYAENGLPVPEGEPGTNPGALSRDSSLQIISIIN